MKPRVKLVLRVQAEADARELVNVTVPAQQFDIIRTVGQNEDGTWVVVVNIRYNQRAARDQAQTTLRALLNNPLALAGSYLVVHECFHDEGVGGAQCRATRAVVSKA